MGVENWITGSEFCKNNNSVAEASCGNTVKRQMDVIPRASSNDDFPSEIVDTDSCACFVLERYTENLRRKREAFHSFYKEHINENVNGYSEDFFQVFSVITSYFQ